jgi:hypothetical protein
MRKIYKINGKTEAHEIFTSPSGKTIYKVAFTKGNLDPKNRVPARFTTDNEVIMNVIESSPKFGKTIFLEKVYGEPVPAVAPAPVADKKTKAKTAKASETRVMADVKTLADAATVLVAEGASAADIDGTVETAVRVAKSMGISFPNLKEE